MEKASKDLAAHYEKTFEMFGPSSMGVDWGEDESNLDLRYEKMLAVMQDSNLSQPTLLDVGCGFGGLLRYIDAAGIHLDYTGVDIAENMIQWARTSFPNCQFYLGDFLELDFDKPYSYVVCNGILTQKLTTPGLVMDEYAHRLIRRMYDLCLEGIAFNVMTTKVNHFADNLYYRNPSELLSWCMSEITRFIRIDHAYPLFEYTVYLYREAQADAL